MPPNIKLWKELAIEACPLLTEAAAELLYFRAATAWGSNQQFEIADGMGGQVDLTKLYEQCKIMSLLKGEYNGNKES